MSCCADSCFDARGPSGLPSPAIWRWNPRRKQVAQHAANLQDDLDLVDVMTLYSRASGPAEKTNKIRTGDLLNRVNGRFVRGVPASKVAPLVLGPSGTIVELSFKRVQGPAVMTINVACVREPQSDPPGSCHSGKETAAAEENRGHCSGGASCRANEGGGSDECADSAATRTVNESPFTSPSHTDGEEEDGEHHGASREAFLTSDEVHRTLQELAAVRKEENKEDKSCVCASERKGVGGQGWREVENEEGIEDPVE